MRRLIPLLAPLPLAVLVLLAAIPAISAQDAPPKAAAKPKAAAPSSKPAFGPPPPEVAQAIQRYQAGDVPGAIALLEPLRGKPGAHPAALSLLGTLYLEAGRAQDALAVLAPVAESGAAGPVILQTAGRAALAAGRTDQAVAYLQKAVEKAPGSPASRDLGLLLGSQSRIEESYRLLRPWAKEHPDDLEARLSAAYGALQLERAPEAAELLAGLSGTAPGSDPRIGLLQARLLLLQQQPRQALGLLDPLLAAAPPGLAPEIRRYQAEAHLALGESDAAVKALQGQTGSDPSLALLLGRALYQAGDPAGSAAALEPFARDLLAGQPSTPAERGFTASFARQYGQALVGSSKWPEAIAALEVASRLEPDNLQAWQLLGRAQLAAGRREEAARSMARFQELQKGQKSNTEQYNEEQRREADPTWGRLRQADQLAAAGKTDEALALIRRERELVPEDPRPRLAEGDLLVKAGRLDEAVQLAEREGGAGRKEEARELLKKVLAARPGDARAAAALKKLG